MLKSLNVDKHPDKTWLNRAKTGFDFLGFRITPTSIQPSAARMSRRDRKVARLYEQGASKRRIGLYLGRCLVWGAGFLFVPVAIGAAQSPYDLIFCAVAPGYVSDIAYAYDTGGSDGLYDILQYTSTDGTCTGIPILLQDDNGFCSANPANTFNGSCTFGTYTFSCADIIAGVAFSSTPDDGSCDGAPDLHSNTAPTADAGVDQSNVPSGFTVTLDGSGSSDPDSGQTLSYAWAQIGTPTVTLNSDTQQKPTFTAPTISAGAADVTLTFSLVVNDGTVDSTADTVSITVKAPANTMPTAAANIPVFGPFGILAVLLGLLWFGNRRRKH